MDWESSKTLGVKKISSIFEQRNEKVSDKDFEPLSVTKMGILKQLENVAKQIIMIIEKSVEK